MSCFAMLTSPSRSNRRKSLSLLALVSNHRSFSLSVEYHANESAPTNNTTALSRLTPGAYSNLPTTHKTNSIEDSLSLDISQLRKQYRKLQDRNKQVQIMIQSSLSLHVVSPSRSTPSIFAAASNEQRQRTRTPSIHPSLNSGSEMSRRSTISSLEFTTPRLPSTVCSITGGPLVRSSVTGDHRLSPRLPGQSSAD